MHGIPSPDVAKFEAMFERLGPVDGKLDGEKCKPTMMNSQLSTETLGRIWDLSDIDADGSLDKGEFVLAMHLIHLCVEGEMLPDVLPQDLIPSGKERYITGLPPPPPTCSFAQLSIAPNLALVPSSKTMWPKLGEVQPSGQLSPHPIISPIPSCWPYFTSNQPFSYPPWAISPEELAKSSRIFSTIDLDADGLVSGTEVRDILLRSGLQQSILAQIWDLVDIQCSGMLNCEQFAVAMHLATEQLSSMPYANPLPAILPPALIPPSLRPLPPDPAMFEESNRLIAEIESLNRERSEVEAAYATLTVEAQRRATETTTMQRKLDTLNHTARSLVNQRTEAERRLAEYTREKETLEGLLKDLKSHVLNERHKAEEIRDQVNSQQASTKNQEESIIRLRTELNELIREEAMLQDRVAESRRRLERIEAENRASQTQIEKATARVASLESTRGQLLQVLDQYTSFLNGEDSASEPDERKVKALLQVGSLDGSVNSLDTGLGGSTNATAAQNGTTAFSDSVWPDTSVPAGRPLGAASVPLSVMSANPVNAFDETPSVRGQAVSALGLPIVGGDPFRDADPFDATSVIRDFSSASNAQKDDLFGSTSLFPASDPFKYIDPFGGDPFSVSTNAVNGKNCSDIISDFDPFTSTVNPVIESKSIVTGADFDAVFGAPDAPPPASMDPFGADPFSSVEQKALCGDLETKRSPPPRPKTQPGVSKQARERKSIGDTPDFTSSLGARHSVGSLPDFSVPTVGVKGSANPPTRVDIRLPTGADAQKWSSISRGRFTNKPKKEGDSGSIRSGHPSSKTGCKPCDTSDWNPPGLTEDQQLSIATMESQRLAQLEEKARRQEEADLELAIMLSKMNSAAT